MKNLRKIAILMSLVMSLTAFSQTYFREGVKWVCEAGGNGPGIKSVETYFIQKCQDEGAEAHGMYVSSRAVDSETATAPELRCYIRVDGEKVYFKPVDTDTWYLLYDFGLNPGEGCQVNWGLTGKDLIDHYSCYMELQKLKKNSAYDGWEQMCMTCYHGDVTSGDEGVWLKGLGSVSGPLYNIFGLDGLGSRLVEVWDGDKLVYKYNYSEYPTYFHSGVKWIVRTPNPGASLGQPRLTTYSIDKSVENGEETLSMYSMTMREGAPGATQRKLECYVKTDDKRVYFRPIDSEMWYLMYDFGLNPGETCTVYQAPGDAASVESRSLFLRLEKVEPAPEYAGWELMSMSSRRGDDPESYSCVWLKDLGSPSGPLSNTITSGMAGDYTELIEVWDGDKLVYKNGYNAVSVLGGTPELEIIGNGNSLTIRGNAAAEGFVYSADGALVNRFDFRGGDTTLTLPGPGLYIVKVGDAIRKVISNR